jgi:hypothetical protein
VYSVITSSQIARSCKPFSVVMADMKEDAIVKKADATAAQPSENGRTL